MLRTVTKYSFELLVPHLSISISSYCYWKKQKKQQKKTNTYSEHITLHIMRNMPLLLLLLRQIHQLQGRFGSTWLLARGDFPPCTFLLKV